MSGCQNYTPSFNTPKLDSQIFLPNPTQFARKERTLTPVTQADLVDSAGTCAGAAAAPAVSDGSAAPAAPRGIALEMTECELVQAAGPPGSVQIGAADAGERTVTMTYNTPDQPIYHFRGGRLKEIERGAEPSPEPKKAAPKRKRQSQQPT
jgi:hypothetical protein